MQFLCSSHTDVEEQDGPGKGHYHGTANQASINTCNEESQAKVISGLLCYVLSYALSAMFYECTVSVMDGFQFSPASCSVLKSQSQFPIELLFIVELMVLFVSLHTEST